MTTQKQFAKAVKTIASYKPTKDYSMPDNPPPKHELERKFKLKNNKIIEVKD